MRRASAALPALAAVAVLPGTATATQWHRWAGSAGRPAGQAVVSRGEAIWSDYLFDDYGANVDTFNSMAPDVLIGALSPHAYPADPAHPVGFAPSGHVGRFRHTGDFSYPAKNPHHDPVGDPLDEQNSYDNVADFAGVRLAVDAGHVWLRFSLTDLPKPASTVIGLAIDTNPGGGSGGGTWPLGAGVASGGWDRFLTVWGSGGALTGAGGKTRDLVGAGGALKVNLAGNTIDVMVPRAAIAPAGGKSWRLLAGAGVWDAAKHSWALPLPQDTQSTSPGSLALAPRIYDLAFNQNEPNSIWNETKQANDLDAKAIDSDGWTVDPRRLARGASDRRRCVTGPRVESFSTWDRTEEGLVSLPQSLHNENYVYRWHRQPLAVLLPKASCDRTARVPSLDYFFHPANVNHNAFFVGNEGDAVKRNYVFDSPNMGFSHEIALANRYNRITASGLARTDGWNYGDVVGEEVADRDAFLAATRRYRYDPRHVRVMGMSGRLGAPFFAEMWPDRVSAVATVSNHDADSPRIANLRNTPWVFTNGTAYLDTTDVPSYTKLDDHLNALGYEYVHMTWNGRGHDFNLVHQAYPLFEPWTSEAREVRPARLTYYTDPKKRRPGLPNFPGVAWIPKIKLANPRQPARIDLTDLESAIHLPVRDTRFDCTFTNVGTSDVVELHGLFHDRPSAIRKRMPDRVASGWAENSCTFTVKPVSRPARANALAGSLRNISSITIDLDRTRLHPRRAIDLSRLRTTVPVTVRLRSRHGSHRAVIRPAPG
ncbi:MAG: hypothetical protein QOG41_2254 [Thermoleophilaceae bacterium]|nr:hypothetical protein [Thermoleophilaceae bacterium]